MDRRPSVNIIGNRSVVPLLENKGTGKCGRALKFPRVSWWRCRAMRDAKARYRLRDRRSSSGCRLRAMAYRRLVSSSELSSDGIPGVMLLDQCPSR